MLIPMDDREHATILAALRLYAHTLGNDDYMGEEIPSIASDGDKVKPLTVAEVEALADQINDTTARCIEEPTVVVHVAGGNVQGAMSNVPGLDFELHDNDNQADADYERDERDPEGDGPLDDDEQRERWNKLTAGMATVF